MITGAEPVSSYLVRKNPQESIRSDRTHRRSTIGGSLCRAEKEVLLSIAGLYWIEDIIRHHFCFVKSHLCIFLVFWRMCVKSAPVFPAYRHPM